MKRIAVILSWACLVTVFAVSAASWSDSRRSDAALAVSSSTAVASGPATVSKVIHSGLLNFDLVMYDKPFPWQTFSGRIAAVDEGILITKDLNGVLTVYDFATGQFRPLPFFLPGRTRIGQPAKIDQTSREFRHTSPRYGDVFVYRRNDAVHLMVNYTHFDVERACVTKRIAQTKLPDNWLVADKVNVNWLDRFVSKPCLAINEPGRGFEDRGDGGVLVPDGPDHVVFSTGDFGQDGRTERTARLAQAPDSTLGRVLRMSLDDFSTELLSMGHRNPQGLAFDRAGRLWEVEHGPMGGDELNLIEKDGNYGWPLVTYGVNYTEPEDDNKFWRLNPDVGRHEGYQKPAFHWIPSIAANSLLYLQDFHEYWDGDLLIGTLAAQSIVRVRIDDDRVIGTETVHIGARIRDIAVSGGSLYMLFDGNGFGILTPRRQSTVSTSG